MKRRIDKRIEDGLTRLGEDLKTPPGWEAGVMKAVCEHKTSAFDWSGDIAIRRFCFECGVTLSLGPANEDIPAVEMKVAQSLASLGDGPADIEYDAYDIGDGNISLMISDDVGHIDTVALVNGETDEADREATEAHLADCDECSTALLADMQLAVMLESSAPPIVEDRADDGLLPDQAAFSDEPTLVGSVDDQFDDGGES